MANRSSKNGGASNDAKTKWIQRQMRKPALRSMGSATQRRECLRRLVEKSKGRCRWTGLPLKYDRRYAGGGSRKGSRKRKYLTHPLYATVDHREPGSGDCGHDIVCAYINDAKGQLPWEVWLRLSRITAFKKWMADLRKRWDETGEL